MLLQKKCQRKRNICIFLVVKILTSKLLKNIGSYDMNETITVCFLRSLNITKYN